jgi:S1-C subfamily serine protease
MSLRVVVTFSWKEIIMRRALAGITLLGFIVFAHGAKAWGQVSADQPARSQQRVFLGVAVEPSAEDTKHAGVAIRSVLPDSPAAKAGIKEGDVISKVAGAEVKDFDSLLAVLRKHRPGEQLSFHVMRDGQEKDLNVTLGQLPTRRAGEEGLNERGGAFLGVQTQPLTAQTKERLNVTAAKGVVIMEVLPDTPAAKAGLKRDDVIVSLAGKTITNPQELRDAVHAAGVGKDVSVTVLRGQEKKDIHVRLEESPVDGLSSGPTFPGNGVPGLFAPGRASQLERRVEELEKRVRELEQNRTPPRK